MAAQPEAIEIGVLHGPNLNLLGRREVGVYGERTLGDIDRRIELLASALQVRIRCFQSNSEGELVSWVHGAADEVAGFVVNAGAYTHTSIALPDALVGVGRPYVEVHLSNVAAREDFRRHSYLAERAIGVISGFGVGSYLLGVRALADHLRRAASSTTGDDPFTV